MGAKLLTIMPLRCECCNKLFYPNTEVTTRDKLEWDSWWGEWSGYPKFYIGEHLIRSSDRKLVRLIESPKLQEGNKARFRAWWYRDSRPILCEIEKIAWYNTKQKCWDYDVKPVEGYSHSRVIGEDRLVEEENR